MLAMGTSNFHSTLVIYCTLINVIAWHSLLNIKNLLHTFNLYNHDWVKSTNQFYSDILYIKVIQKIRI